ncbi:peptide ABC transporter permease [Acuticoccus sediminis]|uniref:Peptide ABC transporter permease n=1 Tax=Acuticoccus sediminis TaxID=2184697 RepID=A0A8B2NUY0_9HYPH|nr:ABC transporter permease [Acuticoccus sediminis]RAI01523.1 peptide ABC transporter permease [Acuticoccus sediminis]
MADTAAAVTAPVTPPVRRRRPWPPTLVWGTVGIAIIVAIAVAGAFWTPYPYDGMNIRLRFAPPSAAHWFGTDEFGRDVLSRVMRGAHLSLFMGAFATFISLAIGVPLGLIAGYFRGLREEVIMRAVDVMISIPPIMLGLLILAVTTPDIWKSAGAVGLIYVPIIVRLTRSVTLELGAQEFIEAARARGERDWYILFVEILPNAWPPIIVESALRVTFAILLGAALSFLGLGVQPPASDWGLMIAEGRPFLSQAPWIAIAPGIALVVTVILINLFGDGLRERLDPRLRQKGS